MTSPAPAPHVEVRPFESNVNFTKTYLECQKERNHGCLYHLMLKDYWKNNQLDLCMEVRHRDGQPIAFIETSIIHNDEWLYKNIRYEITRCVEDKEILQACNDINIIAEEHWPSLVAFFKCYAVQQRTDCLAVIPLYSLHRTILAKYFTSNLD